MQGGATQAMRWHRRGAPTPQMASRRLNPKGWWRLRAICGVARRQRCHRIASSSLLASHPQAPPAKGKELARHYTRIETPPPNTEIQRRKLKIIEHISLDAVIQHSADGG